MARSPSTSTSAASPVAQLLTQRDQFSQWLNRLSVASDTVPEGVREKVRGDYEKRLAAVVDQLRGYGDQITQQLGAQRAQLDELTAKESRAQEVLSEAELRHAVGEYDEAQWQKLRAETHRTLVEVREESARISEAIAQLDEVARLIAAPPAPAPVEAPPMESGAGMGTVAVPAVKRPAARSKHVPEPEEVEEPAVEPAPKGGKGGKASRAQFYPGGKPEGKGMDELDFLKSVGGAEAPAAASTRPSEVASPAVKAAVKEEAPAAPDIVKGDGSAGKTLKCAECGTMNRPTEWYCEKCGAELAAL